MRTIEEVYEEISVEFTNMRTEGSMFRFDVVVSYNGR